MMSIPPHSCSICYQPYNNERSPLILITCGHTFCRECLEMIFNSDTKEIPCPECKQSTYTLEPRALPKNRSLLDVIIYHEEVNRNMKRLAFNQARKNSSSRKHNSVNDEQNENVENDTNFNYREFKKFSDGTQNDKTKNLLYEYANILNKLEETYNKILDEHRYLTEISEVLVTREVDDALDDLIDVINDYRNTLQTKIRNEFQKVNLIRDFRKSLNVYKKKLTLYMNKFLEKDNKEVGCENAEVLQNKKCNTDTLKYETLEKREISEEILEKIVTAEIENDKEEIITSFNNETEEIPHEDAVEETINNQNTNSNYQMNCNNMEVNDKNVKEIVMIPNNIIYSFSEFELENLLSEIKFAELYAITLKSYSKEIYNPSKYFFINKFQSDKLTEDLKKLLTKVCDYDENVYRYNLEYLNSPDEKKMLKEVHESCTQSDFRKLRYIFNHFRINPNFIYSEVVDHLTNQHVSDRDQTTSNSTNFANSVNNNQPINLAGSSFNFTVREQNNYNLNPSNGSIFGNVIRNSNQSNQSNQSNSIFRSTNTTRINLNDKIFNLYGYLKHFKDKNELNELLKFLIDEYNYLPLKLELDTSFDVKLVKEVEWKINLNLL
jgi:hypothetical protein